MKAIATLAAANDPISITTTRQEKAIIALLNQPTMKEAAEAAGISEVTLWRWLQAPDFRALYMQARRLAVQRAIARTQAVTSEAVETLREVMECAIPSARVAAARAILDYALKGIQIDDLEQRVSELEAKLAEQR